MVYIYIFFISSCVDGQLGCFYLLVIMSEEAMSIVEQVFEE